ncbi:MAG TPA: hypothetical protein VLK65_29515 [Vicinamibacteria bacterium]|nr:hypothetical protein [Vicinamibacteria bacterium]
MNDRLSPILLKELRQGIRSQLFTGAFLLFQTLLFFFGLSVVSSDWLRQDPASGSVIFWLTVALPLVLLVPATASQAVEKEVAGKTLELLLLTRLSSYRIVLGKWMSAVAQSALILSSVLPYVILRYFLGGVDIWLDVKTMGALLLASCLLAGAAMGFWSVRIPRWAKLGGVLLLLWMIPMLLAVLFAPHGGLVGSPGVGSLLWPYGGLVMFMMLEAAAARIGPPAENHTTRLRALSLVGLAAAFPLSRISDAVAATMAVLIVLPTLVGSLNETVRPVARLYESFTRGSDLRRFAMLPFCPGWPGGLVYAVLVLLALPLLPAFAGKLGFFAWVGLVGTFLVPAALTRMLLSRSRRTTGYYLLLLALSTLPIYVSFVAEGLNIESASAVLRAMGGLVPPLAVVLELGYEGYEGARGVRTLLVILTVASVMVMVRASRAEWRRIERFALESSTS